MKKKRIISLMLLLASSLFVAAEEQTRDAYRHSFRIGWGTAYSNRVLGYLNSYNTIPYYNTDYINNIQGMTAQEAHAYLTNYRMCTSKVNEISSVLTCVFLCMCSRPRCFLIYSPPKRTVFIRNLRYHSSVCDNDIFKLLH